MRSDSAVAEAEEGTVLVSVKKRVMGIHLPLTHSLN